MLTWHTYAVSPHQRSYIEHKPYVSSTYRQPMLKYHVHHLRLDTTRENHADLYHSSEVHLCRVAILQDTQPSFHSKPALPPPCLEASKVHFQKLHTRTDTKFNSSQIQHVGTATLDAEIEQLSNKESASRHHALSSHTSWYMSISTWSCCKNRLICYTRAGCQLRTTSSTMSNMSMCPNAKLHVDTPKQRWTDTKQVTKAPN